MAQVTGRALHFVFKVGDRPSTIKFFRNILGMKVLRHEEFEAGCKAACNGPYDGKWSKTMIGYGPEDNHFVIELTYNYGVRSYNLGNDFLGITLQSKEALDSALKHSWPISTGNILEAPGGYKFRIKSEPQPTDHDPVAKVTLASSDLQKSLDFWCGLCGMKIYSRDDKKAEIGFSENQCKLELVDIGTRVDHGTAFGRIAFSCPKAELQRIQDVMLTNGQNVMTPLVSLDTPGKATVQVVILGDVDGHEICFVGDEAFGELSQFDPNAEELLNDALAADKSDEWFEKKGLSKAEA